MIISRSNVHDQFLIFVYNFVPSDFSGFASDPQFLRSSGQLQVPVQERAELLACRFQIFTIPLRCHWSLPDGHTRHKRQSKHAETQHVERNGRVNPLEVGHRVRSSEDPDATFQLRNTFFLDENDVLEKLDVYVRGDTAFISCSTYITVWNWAEGTGCQWDLSPGIASGHCSRSASNPSVLSP